MAGLLDIPKLVDYRDKVNRHETEEYPILDLEGKTIIAIHHSMTEQGESGSNAEGYAEYHVDTNGWPSIAYSYVIEPDGTIKFCNDIELRTYHVGDHNNYAVGICMTGDFRVEELTEAQKESLRNLVEGLQKEFKHLEYIKGHNEFEGYGWKECPAFDYCAVLNQEGSNKSAEDLPNQYKVQEGDTFWSIAKGLEDVSVNDLEAANPDVDPTKLELGQKISLGEAKDASKDSSLNKVAEHQEWMNGYSFNNIAVDGIHGPNTEEASIKAYQHELNEQFNASIAVDGIWGPATEAASVTVTRGAQGNITQILQGVLYGMGHNPNGYDGIYGGGTESAVELFQSDEGIGVDGKVGKVTYGKLFK